MTLSNSFPGTLVKKNRRSGLKKVHEALFRSRKGTYDQSLLDNSFIMKDFRIRSSDIINIGDASSAYSALHNKKWSYSGKPDIVVTNLEEQSEYI